MSSPDYQHSTINSAADGWLLVKKEIGVLLDFASKEGYRPEHEHIAFTDHSIMATDGHKLAMVTQKGRIVHQIASCIFVDRDVLLRAKRAMSAKMERLFVPLQAGEPIRILRWKSTGWKPTVDEGRPHDTVLSFPPDQTKRRKTKDTWSWPARIRGLVEEQENPKGKCDYLNPDYFARTMAAFKAFGYKTVLTMMGKKKKKEDYSSSVFHGHSGGFDVHPLDLTIVVMGMRV